VRRIPNAEREVWKAWWLDANRLILEAGGGFFMTLWAANLRGEEWTPLTREFAALTDFDATPDRNTAVAIRSERRTGLWSMDATGGTARIVVEESGSGPGFPALDESGGVLYSALLNDGTFGVYRVAPNTTRSVLVASGVLTPDSWSVTPDGRIVVFTGREAPYPLRRVNVDGSGLTTLVPSNGGAPSITPDGRTVIFSPAAPGILSVPIDGGPVTKVSDRPICCPPVISPDGRRMIVPAVGRETAICELPDCSRPIVLRLQVPVAPAPLRWAPDGHGIAFVPANDSANIWVQPLDGGTPRRITTLGDLPILDFSWSPDGTRLVMSRGRYHTDLVILKGLLHAPSR
jgi:hypothetical protein